MITKPILFALLFALTLPVAAEDPVIAKLFAQQGMQGTLVISSLRSGQTFIHNDSRATRRFIAASTFKILNTLISLEEGIVVGKDSTFKWNGHTYSIANWNRDQTLESAFKVSCVWCFQQIAEKVGAEKYRDYLTKSQYGKLHEPFVETTFWLDGSLQISAIEQVKFLKNIYQRSLPFSTSSYETLRQIMVVEQTPSFTIRAKTGLGGQSTPQVGWYVGYVETAQDVWFFAVNLEIHSEKDLPLRLQLTRQSLQVKGVFN